MFVLLLNLRRGEISVKFLGFGCGTAAISDIIDLNHACLRTDGKG